MARVFHHEEVTAVPKSRVVSLTRAQVRARYDELAGRVGDVEAFMCRGADYALSADDTGVYDELRGLEFLLGVRRDLCTGAIMGDPD